MSDNVVYFNFPVQLLEGFLDDTNKSLRNILFYHLYKHSLKLECGSVSENFEAAAEYFSVTLGDKIESFNTGKHLYSKIPKNSPRVGIEYSVFWNYHDNYKTEYEKICLLAFLALKSILGAKPYCKLDNKFWLSRMAGLVRTVDNVSELDERIRKYYSEYQSKKLKNQLVYDWGLITYSRYTRGFYVSFSFSLEELIFQAEKKRKAFKDKQEKEKQKEALKRVMDRLYQPP